MVGRLAIVIAVATCLVGMGQLSAQQYLPPPTMASAAPGMYASGPPLGGAYGSMPPMMAGPAPYAGAQPDGGYCNPYAMGTAGGFPSGGPCMDCNGNAIADNKCPPDVDRSPLEEAICAAVHNATFQLDFIHWGISRPTTTVIGAVPSIPTMNPNFEVFPFDAFFTPPLVRNPTTTFFDVDGGFASEFNTDGISLSGNPGVQGTISVPYTWGTLEFSGFILQKASSSIFEGNLPVGTAGNQQFVAIGLTSAGAPSSNLLLFDQFFGASVGSFLFGGEVNFVSRPIVPKENGIVWMPLVGFRYVGLQEEFNVVGISTGVQPTTISSRTINNIFGPQIGMRFEFVNPHFTIGAEPKVMLGVNDMVASVASSDPTIGNNFDESFRAMFAAWGALNVYAKIPLHENFKVFVAYNLMGGGLVSRPSQQVVYDETAGGANNIHLDVGHNAVMVQGYSVGGEITF